MVEDVNKKCTGCKVIDGDITPIRRNYLWNKKLYIDTRCRSTSKWFFSYSSKRT